MAKQKKTEKETPVKTTPTNTKAKPAANKETEKPATKPSTTKAKPAAKKPVTKPVAKKTTAKPSATKAKPVAKKPATKPAAKKATAKPSATKAKPAAKKPATKPVTKKAPTKTDTNIFIGSVNDLAPSVAQPNTNIVSLSLAANIMDDLRGVAQSLDSQVKAISHDIKQIADALV